MSVFHAIVALTWLLGLTLPATSCVAAPPSWPQRVLITNDNGIDDPRMIALARSLARVAEVTVVAATTDRSGTSNLISAARTGEFRVEPRDLGAGIEAYALDGYPADCVVFALAGPMRDAPPDLVVSGINGGPNLGDDWFGSGTIGAARTAAYFGIPAVAVSGLRSGDLEARQAVVAWVTDFVQSEIMRDLRAPQYLTVSLPLAPPSEIRGVVVAERARGLLTGRASIAPEQDPGAPQVWRLEVMVDAESAPAGSDVAAASDQYIAIVPMRVNEMDAELARTLAARSEALPQWDPTAYATSDTSRCRSGFGAMIDDAENDDHLEWGVLVVEVLAGGRAEEMGLREGDVLVALNGVSLSEDADIAREDPVVRFQQELGRLDCGDRVTIEYMRGTARRQGSFEITTPK